MYDIIPTISAQISPVAPLEYLAFGIHALDVEERGFWPRLGYLLERALFFELKEIVFDLIPIPVEAFEELEQRIRKHLPDCDARGILRVTTLKVRLFWISGNR
jgi:hypothetical protein